MTPANQTLKVFPLDLKPGELLLTGQLLGHYQIVRSLGKGGMGAVYEADDLETGRRVALKVLSHSLDSPEARKRFLREGRLAASINHPNIVYIFGTEEIQGTPVIAMELVSGGNLEERVRARSLPIAEAVDAALQIINGLEAAQATGILHRDIKPANCFVDPDGTVKIGDFGLSITTGPRADTKLTMAGSFMGTPAYSSPEQLRGEDLNVCSDIYAVGVTLYFLLTGKTPFQGENLVQLLATILERPAPSPIKWRPEIPKGLGLVVLRCLHKQATERFKNYAQFREALLPYSSTAATPATLGLRFLAGCIDTFLLSLVSTVLGLLFRFDWELLVKPPGIGNHSFIYYFSNLLVVPLYYGLLEGIWGCSLGKMICRLQVVDARRNVPGIPRALLRSVIIELVPALPILLWLEAWSPAASVAAGGLKLLSLSNAYYVILVLLFSTARRKNGFAAIHDLLSRTRVVLQSASDARPSIMAKEDLAAPGCSISRLQD